MRIQVLQTNLDKILHDYTALKTKNSNNEERVKYLESENIKLTKKFQGSQVWLFIIVFNDDETIFYLHIGPYRKLEQGKYGNEWSKRRFANWIGKFKKGKSFSQYHFS